MSDDVSEASLAYIRQRYGVPAEVGRRVTFKGEPATIVGGTGAYLLLLEVDPQGAVPAHPTWGVDYSPETSA